MNDKPKPERKYKTHTFTTGTEWTGEKSWKVTSEDCHDIEGGPPAQFGGSTGNWSPEELMLTSINTCHLSSFVAYSKRKRFEFVSYSSEIEGILEYNDGAFRFTKMIIRPKVVVKTEEDIETARQYLNRAHELCFMGHSVNAEVIVEPEITVEKSTE